MTSAIPPGGALASNSSADMEESEARQIQTAASAPVSLIMAVAIAEYRSGGRAVHASAEDYDGDVLYDIRTVTPEDVTQLTINPRTGAVVYMGHPIVSGTTSGALGSAALGRTIQPRVSLAAAIT
ncbi:MAG: PepSY domain-containing protein, partial [Hyphomicrobiales bacterium]